MFWHSDKPIYQRDTALKVTEVMKGLGNNRSRQRQWFEAFLYVFNKHWNIVDNFRIDKYLMFLRHMFNETLGFLKSVDYANLELEWFSNKMFKLCSNVSGVRGMAL